MDDSRLSASQATFTILDQHPFRVQHIGNALQKHRNISSKAPKFVISTGTRYHNH